MTRAEYVLAHAPTLLAGLIASGRDVNEDTIEAMAEAAGKLWDIGEPVRQTRSVKDEVGYRTAVEDCIKIVETNGGLDFQMLRSGYVELMRSLLR